MDEIDGIVVSINLNKRLAVFKIGLDIFQEILW